MQNARFSEWFFQEENNISVSSYEITGKVDFLQAQMADREFWYEEEEIARDEEVVVSVSFQVENYTKDILTNRYYFMRDGDEWYLLNAWDFDCDYTTKEVAAFGGNFEDSDYANQETVSFGYYEQDNDTSNGSEAIEWYKVYEDDNGMLLVSKYALDNKPYNEEFTEVSWGTCSLRSWLNDSFYNVAFTDEEKTQIIDTEHDGVIDRVFLLSESEVDQYFTYPAAKCTDYARSMHIQSIYEKGGANCYVNDQLCTTMELATQWMENWEASAGDHCCRYWLRSYDETGTDKSALYIGSSGTTGDYTVTSTVSVRPAIWVRKN